jgi:sodium/bile acid cotransporter 7|tara:strand:- start:2074 stop:3066 length:993 start_codon:yes stop_codon:yes gene_type:complete
MGCVSEYQVSTKKKWRTFFVRYWFLFMLVLMIPCGIWFPEGGKIIKNTGWATPTLVGIMMGISGFTLNTSKLQSQAANLGAIGLVLISIYFIAPLAAYFLAITLQPENNPHFLTAVMILAAQASSLASALALTVLSRGNQEIALIFTLLSSSLTVIMTPLILKLSLGANVEFPAVNMILKMLQVVILPVVLGQIIRRFLWEKSQPFINGIRLAPQMIILIFVYSGFSVATGQIQGNTEIVLRIVLISALLHTILLVWNYTMSLLLRFDSATSTAVVFSGSQKTLPNGIYLWEKFFGDNPIGALPLAIYHLIQLVVDTLLVPFFEHRNKKD